MGQQLGGQPILILKEGTERTRGRDAQSNNIMAAKAVAEAVRTTLGPKGMDKMLVDNLGDVVVTNDGVTILKEMDIAHPAAKMMVEVAKTQDDEVGDGTTTAVVLAGELLKKSTDLMEKDVHPTVLASGFKMAAEKSLELLEKIAIPVGLKDEKMLVNLANTAMTGKSSGALSETLSELSVAAATAVVDEDNKVNVQDDIGIIKIEGGVVSDSRLIEGVIVDKERVHALMPKRVDNAKIALLNTALEIEKTEVDAKIEITSPDQLQEFLDQEEKLLQDMVEKIKKAGTTAIFCQKGIDDLIQHYLSKSEIFAVRRVKESDMKKLAKATGAKVVNTVNELKSSDLGSAGLVEERKIGDEEMTFVEKCSNPKSVTILLRGGTEHVVDELERGLNDALRVIQVVLEDGRYVAGGGATEVELSLRMREFAATVGGREQLAIEIFADALEVIPRTLAENGGLDPIDTIIDLRAQHMDNKPTYGLNVFTGKSMDMAKEGVIEPLKVKSQAISGAADAAVMILRIDDVIAASGASAGGPPPGGDMGGMEDFG